MFSKPTDDSSCHGFHRVAQFGIVWPHAAIPHARPVNARNRTRPPLAHLMRFAQMSHSFPLRAGALPLSRGDIRQHGVSQHLFGKKILQFGVLGFELSQLAGIRHFQASKLRITPLVRRRADPVLPTYICCRHDVFLALQGRDDLLLAEPWSLLSLSFVGADSTSDRRKKRVSGQRVRLRWNVPSSPLSIISM